MSYSEMIDYEALSIKAKAICGIAQSTISKIEHLLNMINETSKTLQTPKMMEFERFLLLEKANMINQINGISLKADEQAKLGQKRMKIGTSEMSIYEHRNDLIIAARNLQNKADILTIEKIEVLQTMINEELVNIANQTSKDIKKRALGIIDVDKAILNQIDMIEDVTLRESVYRVASEQANKNKAFQELFKLGEERLKTLTQDLLEKHRQTILEGIQKEMQSGKVDQQIIDKVIQSNASIKDIREQATNEIVSEEVRKESLKIILKAIESRGFVVDRKNSIKINKDKNEVNVVGKKASGQTAEFKIFLDGRCSYKFDGFEGQSCQKDIEPFMNDLEEIYGMKITGRLELWKNPDKISSQKYQTINTNKNKN